MTTVIYLTDHEFNLQYPPSEISTFKHLNSSQASVYNSLNNEQKNVWNLINTQIEKPGGTVTVVDSGPGVGKTHMCQLLRRICLLETCWATMRKNFAKMANGCVTTKLLMYYFGNYETVVANNFDIVNPKPIIQPQIIFIDEMSQESNLAVLAIVKLCYIHQINLILLGDTFQIPPIGEKAFPNITLLREIPNIKIIEMNTQVRIEDQPYLEVLEYIRNQIKLGETQVTFFVLLKLFRVMSNKFTTSNILKPEPQYFFIASTNKELHTWNNAMMKNENYDVYVIDGNESKFVNTIVLSPESKFRQYNTNEILTFKKKENGKLIFDISPEHVSNSDVLSVQRKKTFSEFNFNTLNIQPNLSTFFSCQGSTITHKIVVSISLRTTLRDLYVGLSRVKSRDGIHAIMVKNIKLIMLLHLNKYFYANYAINILPKLVNKTPKELRAVGSSLSKKLGDLEKIPKETNMTMFTNKCSRLFPTVPYQLQEKPNLEALGELLVLME